mmetsp:Transcript_40520/g.160776  ORF Transcript_40520/g.160776 Transcript_40520/m.160776 type:complete len:213 (+) Transcript_40520:1500-2138(+)
MNSDRLAASKQSKFSESSVARRTQSSVFGFSESENAVHSSTTLLLSSCESWDLRTRLPSLTKSTTSASWSSFEISAVFATRRALSMYGESNLANAAATLRDRYLNDVFLANSSPKPRGSASRTRSTTEDDGSLSRISTAITRPATTFLSSLDRSNCSASSTLMLFLSLVHSTTRHSASFAAQSIFHSILWNPYSSRIQIPTNSRQAITSSRQ